MANTNKPFGLRFVGSMGQMNGRVEKFYTNTATAFYIGDQVILSGTSGSVNADDISWPGIDKKTAAAQVPAGFVVGFQVLPDDLAIPQYHKASVSQYVFVCTDPDAICEVQGDATVWAVTHVGLNATPTISTGATSTGVSNMTIGAATGTSNAYDFQILRHSPLIGNEWGAYARFLVRQNLHQYKDTTTGL